MYERRGLSVFTTGSEFCPVKSEQREANERQEQEQCQASARNARPCGGLFFCPKHEDKEKTVERPGFPGVPEKMNEAFLFNHSAGDFI
jgi:hypothetical protein